VRVEGHEEPVSWGSDAFESWYRRTYRGVPEEERDYRFPDAWKERGRRRDAYEQILEPNLRLLERYRKEQFQVLQAAYQLGEIAVDRADRGRGIRFRVQVRNATKGHNAPTGFIAERTLYLEVTVRDAEGRVVFRSGDTDPNGDVRDLHSVYVHNGELSLDDQLFSLQSKFITRNVRGSEREQVLAVNQSVDPLPFLRPAVLSTVVTGRPLAARIHRKGIEPLGHRWAHYRVEPDALTGKPPYTARIRLIAGMVPLNLVHEIAEVGFDYGMSPREIGDRIVEGRQVLADRELTLLEG